MDKKLYYHKTDGGAEYLTDTFIPWKHNGKSGKEGVINYDTKIVVRIDGDITKDAEITISDERAELLDALKMMVKWAELTVVPLIKDPEVLPKGFDRARTLIQKVEGK